MISLIVSRIFLVFLYVYRWFVSPYLKPRCRFEPSCSRYAIGALSSHGGMKGFCLIFRRLIRCHPFEKLGGSWGYDPVPPSDSYHV